MDDNLPEGFNRGMAIDMACASRAVYDTPLYSLKSYMDAKRLRDPKIQTFRLGDPRDDTFGVAWITGGQLFIVFRGTRSFRNWLEDMDVAMSPFDESEVLYYQPGTKVHQGFKSSVDDMWKDISAAVCAYETQKVRNGIIISGHSLGAAQAAICAAYIWTRFRIRAVGYTFGQPQVGNRQWRKFFNATFPYWFRMIHEDDIVCRIPRLLWYYVQTLTDMFFDESDTLHVNMPSLRKLPYDLKAMYRHHFIDFDILIEDHGIQNYVELLQRKWAVNAA